MSGSSSERRRNEREREKKKKKRTNSASRGRAKLVGDEKAGLLLARKNPQVGWVETSRPSSMTSIAANELCYHYDKRSSSLKP
jgi:hypothetical protein